MVSMNELVHPFLKSLLLRLIRVRTFDHDEMAREIARTVLDAIVASGVVGQSYVRKLEREVAELATLLRNGEYCNGFGSNV